ncbi:protein jagged-1-like [Mytilus californianus]|uniref:protein jagged-1-like n=1 Tax=Mytilus californianus TaxID=6549 RepID=UPI0022468176|nr:protein jagged-1-like [Mytilus californianus]
MSCLCLVWTLFFVFPFIQTVYSSGIVEIRLLKYINAGGVGSNGHCCDGRGPFCFSHCDHKFRVCIDDPDGPEDIHTCPYYHKDSGEIQNSNIVTFGSSIAGIRNPIIILFDSWPGELKLKVEVWDVDDNNNDYVDFLSDVFGLKAARSKLEAPVAAFQIKKRTLLTYNVKVYCDEFYYGEHCEIFCKPSDGDFGHYKCDSTTGMQICDPGWSGQFCDESNIDECQSCNVSQTCINTPSGYGCVCPDGFKGYNCDESINATCKPDTCMNGGTCNIVRGHVICDCPHGFIGLTCNMEFDMCADISCQNGGTCMIKHSDFYCRCTSTFTGKYCEDKLESKIMMILSTPTNETIEPVSSALNSTELTHIDETTFNTTNQTVDNANNKTDIVKSTETTTSLSSTTMPITSTVKQNIETTTETITRPYLTVRGRVDKNNREIVGKGIRNLLYDLMKVKDQLYLSIQYKVKTTSVGDIVSEIIIMSAKDGHHTVNSTLIQHIFDETPTEIIESHIHMPIVRAKSSIAHLHEVDPHKNSFMHVYWYVVVILVLVVCCLIIAVGIFICFKHKKLAEPNNKEEIPNQNPGISQPTSSQSFENSLYFEVKKNNTQNNTNLAYSSVP